jgi:hypothetical protein
MPAACSPENLKDRTKNLALQTIRFCPEPAPQSGRCNHCPPTSSFIDIGWRKLSRRLSRSFERRLCFKAWHRARRGRRNSLLAGTARRQGNRPSGKDCALTERGQRTCLYFRSIAANSEGFKICNLNRKSAICASKSPLNALTSDFLGHSQNWKRFTVPERDGLVLDLHVAPCTVERDAA